MARGKHLSNLRLWGTGRRQPKMHGLSKSAGSIRKQKELTQTLELLAKVRIIFSEQQKWWKTRYRVRVEMGFNSSWLLLVWSPAPGFAWRHSGKEFGLLCLCAQPALECVLSLLTEEVLLAVLDLALGAKVPCSGCVSVPWRPVNAAACFVVSVYGFLHRCGWYW